MTEDLTAQGGSEMPIEHWIVLVRGSYETANVFEGLNLLLLD
jgi:hypothetical protein